jgi:hypothetical protein
VSRARPIGHDGRCHAISGVGSEQAITVTIGTPIAPWCLHLYKLNCQKVGPKAPAACPVASAFRADRLGTIPPGTPRLGEAPLPALAAALPSLCPAAGFQRLD